MIQLHPITISGLYCKKEIQLDMNLIMTMYHAYISYLPIEQRYPEQQLNISKQMLELQDLYNIEQKAIDEYMEKKADEEAVKDAGVGVDKPVSSTNNEPSESKIKQCPECYGKGHIDGLTCSFCNGAGWYYE